MIGGVLPDDDDADGGAPNALPKAAPASLQQSSKD